MSEKRIVSRNVAIALGLVCIILVAGLAGALVSYTLAIGDRDNTITSKNNQIASLNTQIWDQNRTISSSNSQISQLNSSITSLQAWVEGNETLLSQTVTWLNGNITYYNSQISSLNSQIANLQNQLNSLGIGTLGIIVSNPSVWVNKTVIVQGVLAIPAFLPWEIHLWNYLLVSSNFTSSNFTEAINLLWNGTVPNSKQVQVYGVVRQELEEIDYSNVTETVFYIEAETISPI